MSDKAQLSPEDAQGVLFDEVYLPSFVEKCAQLGVRFPDQESVQAALESTAMLKTAEAAEQSSLSKNAASDLRNALGIAQPQDPAVAEAAEKRAADVARGNKVREAVDALAAAASAGQ